MHHKTRAALMAASILGAGLAGSEAPAITIDFESPTIAGAVAETPGDAFATLGVRFSTVRLSGTVVVGGIVTLTGINGDLRLYRDA
ncbi:MAG: hypothetical protein FJX57_17875, partial [Alphaproteobacteria bacterium]|nr:hypothetical protein [Alphaproteobacteria bacterium]